MIVWRLLRHANFGQRSGPTLPLPEQNDGVALNWASSQRATPESHRGDARHSAHAIHSTHELLHTCTTIVCHNTELAAHKSRQDGCSCVGCWSRRSAQLSQVWRTACVARGQPPLHVAGRWTGSAHTHTHTLSPRTTVHHTWTWTWTHAGLPSALCVWCTELYTWGAFGPIARVTRIIRVGDPVK